MNEFTIPSRQAWTRRIVRYVVRLGALSICIAALALSAPTLASPATQFDERSGGDRHLVPPDVKMSIDTDCIASGEEAVYEIWLRNEGDRRRTVSVRIKSIGPASTFEYHLRPGRRVLSAYHLGPGLKVRVTYITQRRTLLRSTLLGGCPGVVSRD